MVPAGISKSSEEGTVRLRRFEIRWEETAEVTFGGCPRTPFGRTFEKCRILLGDPPWIPKGVFLEG